MPLACPSDDEGPALFPPQFAEIEPQLAKSIGYPSSSHDSFRTIRPSWVSVAFRWEDTICSCGSRSRGVALVDKFRMTPGFFSAEIDQADRGCAA